MKSGLEEARSLKEEEEEKKEEENDNDCNGTMN